MKRAPSRPIEDASALGRKPRVASHGQAPLDAGHHLAADPDVVANAGDVDAGRLVGPGEPS